MRDPKGKNCGGVMFRISLPYIYDLSAKLRGLRDIKDGAPIKDVKYILFSAESTLEIFLYQSVYATSLKATSAPGTALLQTIKRISTSSDQDKSIDFIDTWSMSNALEKFETVLTAEMNITPAFFVLKKRGFDTTDLIDNAEVLFPIDLKTKVPEAIGDIEQAGKCIAFEIPTAAGFHMMRALEHVLRLYYDAATSGAARPSTNNMRDCVRELENKKCGDAKIIAVLRQIKDLHRNNLLTLKFL